MHYTRAQALDKIRSYLTDQRGEDETTCQTAARLGIFCRGYDKWSTDQLRGQYPWLAKKLPADAPREELLKLAVAWDGARALVHHTTSTCDVKSIDHDGCLGFERFSNDQLKELLPQVFAAADTITEF